mmetsp:Transcript_46720/g.123416  ORF Transcript_46720/g.123416 Transcript_46720/m.123416 type:complete len:176 (+) Transcript_46720:104-631(+)
MPIDYSKFDHIDSSDDETPAKAPPKTAPATKAAAQAEPADPTKVPEEHATPLDDAPEIQLPEGAWTKYYLERMTAPQRMQTMVHLWNSAGQEERVVFLRHLIDIIDNPQVSNRIKGGQEVLKDLDPNFYHGVTFPQNWVDHFKERMPVDDKKLVFEKLFKSLDQQERGLVMGTLM